MKSLIKKISFTLSVCMVGTFLFAKSLNYVRNNEVISLLIENVEALSTPDGIYATWSSTGTCGAKVVNYYPYEFWQIWCGISYEQAMHWISPYPSGQRNWCCDSCGSSTYCDGRY